MNQKYPYLLLDEDKCRNNIRKMAAKAEQHNLKFRPHFKTHQSCEIGSWFRQEGVKAITVSSISQAEYFAADGWDDITIAFPFYQQQIESINRLAERINLNILLAQKETIHFLKKNLYYPAGFYLEIDTGDHRTGIDVRDLDRIHDLLKTARSCSRLNFKGFLTHSGNTYRADSVEEILSIHQEAIQSMMLLKTEFKQDYPMLEISIGDTPGCSLSSYFDGVDEIRPGNFVFYDLMQLNLGICQLDEIAAALICPVISVSPERNQAAVHGGAVHLSKEFILWNGERIYGIPVRLTSRGWDNIVPGSLVLSLSQEHGILGMPSSQLSKIKTGDLLGILPVHSCLTADLMKGYRTITGEFIDHL